ncbi:NADPH-dependent ferric siderophore reductase [Haloactinopolyspora alba]|uniref:NADPH-dependent ferric siderophore reductase n=1 Tax=Haloactinopolyspora alba TaxID=648780 RepID=A0A2P8E5E5_9ACTN|nr:siderophore-interacting protein [Haloactinopolyspora alba]PSL04681.1 NADPH-dependent ferric siderophore reductase [Haloactinopolyspora alba]
MTVTTEHAGQTTPATPWRPFRVTVAGTHTLSPSFVRITFTGDDLHEFGHDGPDQRVKLYLSRDGRHVPELSPTEWYREYRAADPETRGFLRTYTIRAVRPDRREVDIDFALHGDHGPASAWASRAAVGDEVALIGPNRAYGTDCQGHEWNPPVDARDVLVAGDETALPAVAGILESLRDSPACPRRVRVLLEVPDDGDVLDLPAPEHAEVTWLCRRRPDGSAAANGALLVDAVLASDFGTGPHAASADASAVDTVDIDLEVLWEVAAGAGSPVYAWVAGEAGAVKTIRRHLVGDRGIDKGAVTFMGYWRTGRAEC